ncbi:uncharacterized protein LOC114853947 isoform X2 [Betta splendens]|uniref:Uncharacterized protein LOC114853947 isoform X2 n=1 Tax=Betta splendens TaxID=158456 RepID=A0A9W2XPP3_BETSP|nr:uncharacterized protein LOC114853947 isoform X2 [Betta splendens]
MSDLTKRNPPGSSNTKKRKWDQPSVTMQPSSSCTLCDEVPKDPVLIKCGHWFCRQCITSCWVQSGSIGDSCPQCGKKSTTPGLRTDIKSSTVEQVSLLEVLNEHKISLRKRFEESDETQSGAALIRIYPDLYIIEGQSGEVNTQHEVMQLETVCKKKCLKSPAIKVHEIFKSLPNEQTYVRVVLTIGVAGVGKTFSVQKFILDWAGCSENQDVDLLVLLSFRELNAILDDEYSLLTLLHDLHPILHMVTAEQLADCKLLFIFDGLDESRLSLDFNISEVVSDVTENASVEVLLTNLIQGNLLPSALVWITSRPAAPTHIPPTCVDRVTEVRGFTDAQKDEYFRRMSSHEDLSSRIISHVKTSRSLHIMCQIPVFCWITATVLEHMLTTEQTGELPKTLTDLYSHFLLVQTRRKRNNKEHEMSSQELTEADREVLLKLGKLAWEHLEKGHILFYEEDLKRLRINVQEALDCPGLWKNIFKKDKLMIFKPVYCFVHLSIQEFLAAVYIFHSYANSKMTAQKNFLKVQKYTYSQPNAFLKNMARYFGKYFDCNTSFDVFLMKAMRKSLSSKHGHLDLFIRFLHGLSLESNQSLLGGLIGQLEDIPQITDRVINNLKMMTNVVTFDGDSNHKAMTSADISPDRSMNIFHCLMEMNDQSVDQEIQDFLKSGDISKKRLSEIHCSALAYMLQISEEVLEEVDLKKYNTSEEGRQRLIPAVRNCRKAQISGCELEENHCGVLASVLQSYPFHLRELSLSCCQLNRVLLLKTLFAGLENPSCRLATLRLRHCSLSGMGCALLVSALKSNPSHLRQLELSVDNLQDSGVKALCGFLEKPDCQLEILRLRYCCLSRIGCMYLALAVKSNPSHLKELDITGNEPWDSVVRALSDFVKNPHFRLETLRHGRRSPVSAEEGLPCCSLCHDVLNDPMSTSCGHWFCRQCVTSYWDQCCAPKDHSCPQCGEIPRAAEVTESQASNTHNRQLQEVSDEHKLSLRMRYGCSDIESQFWIYPDTYVTVGHSEETHVQHEVMQLQTIYKKKTRHGIPIKVHDIFKGLNEHEIHIRVVLTKGVAGIGKTFSVQKFTLDWAEGRKNPDIIVLVLLSFRELNLIRDEQHSLLTLLHVFHPTLQKVPAEQLAVLKLLFIFDGLDESRLSLDFSHSELVSDVTHKSSVNVLLTNLIQGNLLPSALVWITSRPAAAHQIPPTCVDRVTEVRGFTDAQKDEYFRRRSTEDLSSRIISHVKTSRSLHIMCQIPVFCWITATVLEHMLTTEQRGELPKTLTDLYSHFLLVLTQKKRNKYHKGHETSPQELTEADRDVLLKLGRLAWEYLQKGNIMFYQEDLEQCGLDVTEALVHSGVCTEIFKVESVILQKTVYCFVHLSVQEFLAAVYIFHCYINRTSGVLDSFLTVWENGDSEQDSLDIFLSRVLDKSLESTNGHLDLMVQFLHGFSLEKQTPLGDLLCQTKNSLETNQKTKNNLKEMNKDAVSPERCINVVHCLLEMNDCSVYDEVQEFLRCKTGPGKRLSEIQCSALAKVLLSSEQILDTLDLERYNTSREGHLRLIPALRNCRTARLSGCEFKEPHCEVLASCLNSNPSHLRELDLSHSQLNTVTSVKLFFAGLKSLNCRLKILRLMACSLPGTSCALLAAALMSNPFHLRELDLSINDLGDSGAKDLFDFLACQDCRLDTLSLNYCSLTSMSCDGLTSALNHNPFYLRTLNLVGNDLEDGGVNKLTCLVENSKFKLETVRIENWEIKASMGT